MQIRIFKNTVKKKQELFYVSYVAKNYVVWIFHTMCIFTVRLYPLKCIKIRSLLTYIIFTGLGRISFARLL